MEAVKYGAMEILGNTDFGRHISAADISWDVGGALGEGGQEEASPARYTFQLAVTVATFIKSPSPTQILFL